MIIESEGQRWRIAMGFEEALQFQADLAAALRQASNRREGFSFTGPLIEVQPNGRGAPRTLVVSIGGAK